MTHSSAVRFTVLAEADPGALPRTLHPWQQLNIVPRRVVAELDTAAECIRIEIEVMGLTAGHATMIAAKWSHCRASSRRIGTTASHAISS